MNTLIRKIRIYLPFIIFFVLIGYYYYETQEQNIIEQTKENVTIKDNAEIYFIDVGQADSTLIHCDNKYVMIDAGNNKDGTKLVQYLKKLGVVKISYLIATHPHEDHIGGMDNIIQNFEIENYYKTADELSIITYTEIMEVLKEQNIPISIPKTGDKFHIGECNFKIIHIDKEQEELNDTSMVIRLEYGNTSFLFTADATKTVEEKILESKENIQSNVLKVAHHGSTYSNTIDFLKEVNPKYAIISVGKSNDYHYPHESTLNRLQDLGIEIYRTDLDGTIIATTNGKDITFKRINTDTNEEENKNARNNR